MKMLARHIMVGIVLPQGAGDSLELTGCELIRELMPLGGLNEFKFHFDMMRCAQLRD
jgi:hypothetical protein